jgi:hypothetical protein
LFVAVVTGKRLLENLPKNKVAHTIVLEERGLQAIYSTSKKRDVFFWGFRREGVEVKGIACIAWGVMPCMESITCLS